MKITVNETTPPPFFGSVWYWERSPNPFSPRAINPALIQSGLAPVPDDGRPEEHGWMAIDGYENPVGFIADGHAVEAETPIPEFTISPNNYGHISAWQVGMNYSDHIKMTGGNKP